METIRKLYSKIKTLWSFDPVIFGQKFNLGSQKVLIHIPSHIILGIASYYFSSIFGAAFLGCFMFSFGIFISQLFWENLMDGKYYGIAENIFDFIQYLIVPIIILIFK